MMRIQIATLLLSSLTAAFAQPAQQTPAVVPTRTSKPTPPPTSTTFQPAGTLAAGTVWGSDSCSTPDPITGTTGYFTGNATTGPEGQGWAVCDFFNTTVIENDVWFVWTAPTTGSAIAYACPGATGLDPRLAVYEGTQCPGAAPLECSDDDGCTGTSSVGSWVTFETHAGQSYLVQVGSYPGTPTGTGTLNIGMALPSQGWNYQHDATPAQLFTPGLPALQGIAWMQRFNAKAGQDEIVSVQVAYGAPNPSTPLVDGTPATVAVWSDPDQDGKPHDAQLLLSVPTTIQNAHTGILNDVALPVPVPVSGKFFVGVSTSISSGQRPAVLANNGWLGFHHSGKAWIVGSTIGPVDLACIGCNDFAPFSMGDPFLQDGQFLLRAKGGGASVTFCPGSPGACPCGIGGGPGEGCANSSGAGALLWSTGSRQVSADDLVLHAMHFAKGGGVALAVTGSQQQGGGAGIPFQSGLLCVGGTVQRYPPQFAIDTFAQGSVVALSNGLITPGTTWYFQVWFRDAQGLCGFKANTSNGLVVDFVP